MNYLKESWEKLAWEAKLLIVVITADIVVLPILDLIYETMKITSIGMGIILGLLTLLSVINFIFYLDD